MTNADISSTFERIAEILSLKDENPFRVRAYERAAQTIAALSQDIAVLYKEGGKNALDALPGIGKDLSEKIEEMVTTGTLLYLNDIEKDVPAGVLQMTEIEGMGPKKVKFVWQKFKVESIEELEALIASGKLAKEKGWGEKSVLNVLQGIEALKRHSGRLSIVESTALATELLKLMHETGTCSRLEIAGSLRRGKETTGDIDMLAISNRSEKAMEAFCALPIVERVLAKGTTKSSVHLKAGIDADLRVVGKESFGAALHYFTGSKEHNIALRSRANSMGMTVNEYGLYKGSAGNKGALVASKTEEDLYSALKLPYIPPELREGRGELDAAEQGTLPMLIEEADLRGDLHMHSTFSDGTASIIDMAKAAKKKGLSYIAITDHASPMGMVAGIKTRNIDEYLSLIKEARKAVPGIEIFAGAEVDILDDGSLYLPDEILKQLDWVNVSIHSHFKMNKEDMTKRILFALNNPYVHCFAHPTARMLLKRDPIEFDIDAVFQAAKKNKVALEINASYERLDLNDILIKRAKEMGCMLTIGSDAHGTDGLQYQFSIIQARRGWAEKGNVLTTGGVEGVRGWKNESY